MNLRKGNTLPPFASHETPRNAFPGPAASAKPASTRRLKGMLALTALLLTAAGARAQAVFATPQNIGSAVTQTVTVTASATGAVSTVEVLTRGLTGLEFTKGGSSVTTPCASASFSAVGDTCNESVTFTPAYPGLRIGAVILLDLNGNVLGTAYVSGVGQGGLNVLTPGNVITVAGIDRSWTDPRDGVAATLSTVYQPASITIDGAGNMYIADSSDNKIRMVCGASAKITIKGTTCSGAGIITTIAGTGTAAYTGDGDLASSANVTLNSPSGVSLDGAGNLYIADTKNNVIREINASTGIISTVVGDGTGTAGYGGDGSKATASGVLLNAPWGITVDAFGDLFIADTANQRIRRVDVVTDDISTAAGDGDQTPGGKGTYSGDGGLANLAGLSLPYAVAFDAAGDMFIPDSANHRIRVVAAVGGIITPSSKISTVAGTGVAGSGCLNGPTASTALNSPSGVAVDAASNLYISDTQDSCIRKANATKGTLTAIAVNGQTTATMNGATGLPELATVYAPIGVYVDGLGNVYFADYFDMLIEEIQSNVAVLDYLPTAVLKGEESASALPQIVENDGNASASINDISATGANNAALDTATTTCNPLSYVLTEDADCTISAYFAPSTTGDPLLGNVFVTGDTVNDTNTPLDIVLVGNAASFTISLTSTPSPTSPYGSPVTLTAKVTASSGTASGSITFEDSLNGGTATVLGTKTLSGGQAIFTTSATALAVGVHTITAIYGTDSSTATVTLTVYENTTTVLASSSNPSTLGAPVTFTATISGTNGGGQTLSGTVTFTDGATTFTNNVINVTTSGATGTATYTATGLPQGANPITAVFTPTTPTLVYTSQGTLNQDVRDGTALTISSTPNPSTYGTAVVFTVGIPTVGSTPASGGVRLQIVPVGSGTAYATPGIVLSGNPATGSYSISALPVGSYNVTATYTGDTNYGPGTATLAPVQVVNQVQTTTTLTATPNPGTAGNVITIRAAVTPNSGTVTPTGTVTITDTLGGTTVTLKNAVALSGGAYSFGTSALAPGTHTLVATYSGDADDASSTSTISLVINQPATTTTLKATPPAGIEGKPVAITATVKADAGTALPAGTVTFTDTLNGTTVPLDGGAQTLRNGSFTFSTSTLAVGTHTVTANYAGDADDAASSGTLTVVVALGAASTTVTAAPNPATVQHTITFSATVTGNGVAPTGTVKFLANGTIALGTGTLSASGKAQVTNATLAAGSYQITAVYSGDADNAASTSAAITEVVGVLPTTTDLSTATTTGANAQTILVSTVQNNGVPGPVPTGTVTFTNGTTTVGSAPLNADGVATLTPNLGAGSYNIIASYPGDALHGPSQSAPVSVNSMGSSYTLTVTPNAVNLATTQNSIVTVKLASVSGFTDTIGLGCASLPAGVNCHFSSISVPLSASAPASTQLTIDTNNPLGGGASAMNKQPVQRKTELAGLFLPFSFLLGWVLWRFRKRHASILSTVLILVLSGAALMATGCIGFTQHDATAGTYTFQVVGVGVNSNVTEYQNVTLTITQ
ncbi:MAG TPA: Ig-like domain repeat protein [Terracidiphilus sp.]